MYNRKQIINTNKETQNKNIKKEGTTMKTNDNYFPRMQEDLEVNCYFVAIQTTTGYELQRLTRDEFPAELSYRPAAGRMTLKAYIKYVIDHFDQYVKAGKYLQAWNSIQRVIAEYNQEVIPGYVEAGKSARIRESQAKANTAAYAIRVSLKDQRNKYLSYAQKLIGFKRTNKALTQQRELYLASARLYDLQDMFGYSPTIQAKEICNVPVVGTEKVNYDNLEVGYDPLVTYTHSQSAATPEEIKYAPRISVPAKRTQYLDVQDLRDDIIILNVLIFKALSNEEFSFRATDRQGKLIEYDRDPAPTTREEYLAWEAKQEFYSYTKPVEEFSYKEAEVNTIDLAKYKDMAKGMTKAQVKNTPWFKELVKQI